MARRSGRRNINRPDEDQNNLVRPTFAQGGRFRPLSNADVQRVTDCAFDILGTIGLAGLPSEMKDKLLSMGASERSDGRVCFGRDLVNSALARAPRHVDLPGFTDDKNLRIGGGRVHLGTGGAAVQILDGKTAQYRDAELDDLYDLMRVLEASPNVHYGVRPVVARDMQNNLELDLNTAFACMKATTKPIGVSFADPSHVKPVIEMFDMALGGPGSFAKRPFCMAVVVHVVPPLRYAEEGVEILKASLEAGMIPQICSAGQAGATSPASLAGALAQGLAESLAGLVLVDAIKPGAPCIYAFMPFIADLRTGAMTGGSGESAVANAAAAQLLSHIGLPSTVSAGMTDAKTQDAQAGYEKGYSITAAGQAGADMINLSVGMLGSIMVASPEALVVDDDMCGAILRSIRGIEISPEGLNLEAIERVVTQEGHYLAETETLKRMKTEYIYPALADRQSVDDWIDSGSQTIWEKAQARVAEIRNSPAPTHLSTEAEAEIRAAFPIRLKTQED